MALIGCAASCGRAVDQSGANDSAPDTVAPPESLPRLAILETDPTAKTETTDVETTAVHTSVVTTVAPSPESAVPEPEPPPIGRTTPADDTQPAGPALRQATFEFTGDTLIHSPIVRRAAVYANGIGYDFAPMFDRVRPILSAADMAICHFEAPVAPPGEPLSTAPRYGVPGEIAFGLASAGFDRCSTASNHSMDRGTRGIDATVNAITYAGMTQAGMARTPEEAVVSLVEINGITVAHLAYTFSFNGMRVPADEPWRSNLIDVPIIIAAAADARARGAEIVIVNLHWGIESHTEVTGFQREVAEALTASGLIDLIVGEHAHVIQPIEQVNGKWVVFGMGNFLSNMPTGPYPINSQDGMIVSVSMTEMADGSFAVDRPTVIPTWVDRTHGFIIRPVLADLADPWVTAAIKDLLYESLQRTGSVVGAFVAT
jgi:Bacterial capsule synthesis protein PGA_cap